MLPRLPLLGDALSRFLELNTRYHGTLARVTADFLRELAVVLESPPRAPEEPRRSPTQGAWHPDETPHPPHQAPPPPAPAQTVARQEPIILLEAEADGTGFGVFLVENHLGQEILARPQVSPFFDPPGATSVPRLVFEPEVISLAPQERALVKVVAMVDRSLQPEVRYRCHVSVPALADTRIPIVIRRRPDRPKVVEMSEPASPETPQTEPAKIGPHSAVSSGHSGETLPVEPKPARQSNRSRKRPRKVKKAVAKE